MYLNGLTFPDTRLCQSGPVQLTDSLKEEYRLKVMAEVGAICTDLDSGCAPAVQAERCNSLALMLVMLSHFYYEGTPLIPDHTFDSYMETLQKYDPQNAVLTVVGSGYSPENAEATGILTKGISVKLKEHNWKQYVQALPDSMYVVMPKYDGISVIAKTYSDGSLDRAYVRGNAENGTNITERVRPVTPSLATPGQFYLQGEGILPIKKAFDLGYESPRNAAVGVAKADSPREDVLKEFKVVYYSAAQEGEELNKTQQLSILWSSGFLIPKMFNVSKKDLISFLSTVEEWKINNPEFFCLNDEKILCDGLVIVENSNPSNQFAYKFREDTAVVPLLDIVMQTSAQGRFNPVGVIEPTSLSNCVIDRVTLHNIKMVLDQKIFPGSRIRIKRSGEVIPTFIEVYEESELNWAPDMTCPVCGQQLEMDGAFLLCKNTLCRSVLEGVNYSFVEFFMEKGAPTELISSIASYLYTRYQEGQTGDKVKALGIAGLARNALVDQGMLISTAKTPRQAQMVFDCLTKVFQFFAGMYRVKIQDFVMFFNIPQVGDASVAKMASAHWLQRDELFNGSAVFDKAEFANKNAHSNFVSCYPAICEVAQCLSPKSILYPENLNPEVEVIGIAMTGEFSKEKKVLVDLWNKIRPVKLLSTVTKDCKFLVCNTPSSSSKYTKAYKMGIPILTEGDFRKVLETGIRKI